MKTLLAVLILAAIAGAQTTSVSGGRTFAGAIGASDPSIPANATTFYGASPPFPYYISHTFNGGSGANLFPTASIFTQQRYQYGGMFSSYLPNGSGYGGVVGIPLAAYCGHRTAGGVCFSMAGFALQFAAGQQSWGANFNATDGTMKDPSDPGYSGFAANGVTGLEADAGVGNSGTKSAISFAGYMLKGSLYQPATSIYSFTGRTLNSNCLDTPGATACTTPASSLPTAPTYEGSGGLNDLTYVTTAGNSYSGSLRTGICWQIVATGTPDQYRYSFQANSVANRCTTGADLLLATTTTASAPSHYFTIGDTNSLGGSAQLQILGGTGCTPALYTGTSAASGVITTSAPMGTMGSTCSYVMWSTAATNITAGTLDMTLPVDTDPATLPGGTQYLNGQATRPIATSYGIFPSFAATTGHTLNDSWDAEAIGVPPYHRGFYCGIGGCDIALTADPVNWGRSQQSQPVTLRALDQTGAFRVSGMYAKSATSTSSPTIYMPNAAGSIFSVESGTTCQAGGCTPGTAIFSLTNGGNLSVTGTMGPGSSTVVRCATAGALPVGALTINAASCGTTADTGLRVN